MARRFHPGAQAASPRADVQRRVSTPRADRFSSDQSNRAFALLPYLCFGGASSRRHRRGAACSTPGTGHAHRVNPLSTLAQVSGPSSHDLPLTPDLFSLRSARWTASSVNITQLTPAPVRDICHESHGWSSSPGAGKSGRQFQAAHLIAVNIRAELTTLCTGPPCRGRWTALGTMLAAHRPHRRHGYHPRPTGRTSLFPSVRPP